MITQPIHNEYIAAEGLLGSFGISMLDAIRIACDAVEILGNDLASIRKGLTLGAEELEKRKCSVPFSQAVEECLEAKKHRRIRTLQDIRCVMDHFLRFNPEWVDIPLRSFSPRDCQIALEKAFRTPRQFFKGRVILSGVFSIGIRRGWCDENPIARVDAPSLKEREVSPLILKESQNLEKKTAETDNGACLPPLWFMLFAGIRPYEVARLSWQDICLDEKVISLRPRHTKTGGTRHVTILPALENRLKEFLRKHRPDPDALICPKNWQYKWKLIRESCGWSTANNRPWQEDCLRHTYASYHAKHFRDYNLLQIEMGHHSSALLRTRYLNMTGVGKKEAMLFWKSVS